ncbi:MULTISPECIES: aldehyde dehydrogenase family protein [Alteromonadaceae]|uniref:aldehyde dehydrogenase family protein n=1 Tax=Alteromonadaceae TaxID=72275 RepID=UPI001C08641D|nr:MULTISPECIES: aldehyde dehydrogenase family protein [Aliiglaciecola]MBU2878804.1 aldehyde dehydrogenase family protein [Aliiglaciecola lipolytica]MDO6711298.1 aldehyde dehydrogenase family protein [Aliiglaciecola sp. 2_MG-2023]MDO6752253.1 aldehyde dehydrogenase family protein [Aliiglaciecola sp. 1_MG-2023]
MNTASQDTGKPAQSSDIQDLVLGIREVFASGYSKEYQWRVEQLKQLELLIHEKQDVLLAALEQDLGKCKTEAWISELGFVLGDIQHTLKHLKKWMKPRKKSTPLGAQPGKSYILPEPLGTILIIGAWNYPFQLLLAPLVAAIAAGNCAVLKPSELAANMSKLLAELIPEYLDNNAFAVVEGAVDETTELLAQRFDHIFYTGGEAVGKIVMSAAAKHLTPVTLELGGKSPCIVDNSANIDVTAARIVWSKWMNAGQTCVAPDYVLVDKSIADQLLVAIERKITAFYGAAAETSKDYGKIINQRHFQRLANYLEGQNVVFGGKQNIQTGYFEPTLVLNPPLDSELMQQEIFGPILPIVTLDSIDQAIPFVNERSKPLALYVYTNNDDYAQKVLHQTSAGNVCVNDGFMFMTNPDLPFGGVGNSGMGSYHGQSGFDRLSHLKTVMERSFKFDVSLRYPPFSKFKLSILKRIL